MGIWTDSNRQTWNVNLAGSSLKKIQNNPDYKFCWIKDNHGIETKMKGETKDEVNQRSTLTVTCADSSVETGYICQWVNGATYGCSLESWFILCTKQQTL
tara:strand:+ start:1572 stop:1871 length:300 start_codon:yes stop_codon:yes gene_type:complete